MFLKLLTIFFLNLLFQETSSQRTNFTYNGFSPLPTDLSLQGITTVTQNGLLLLTNFTVQKTGHAFLTKPIRFKDSPNASAFSFSTTFVFAIHSQIPILSGHGIAFTIAPQPSLPDATASQYIGLFNILNNGNATNNVFAVELDTIRSTEFNDTDDNHVGIDINSLQSESAAHAGWWDEKGEYKNLSLISRKPMQVWVDYDGRTHKIDVRMAPFNEDKPRRVLVSAVRDLSNVLLPDMYVGFSSATGSVLSEHYILGWSFGVNMDAPSLSLSRLPKLPRFVPRKISDFFKIGMPLISLFLIFSVIFLVCFIVRRRRKFAEEHEEWEKEFGKNRFRYKDLYYATKGFKEKDLLGSGGFGSVYKGVMPGTKLEIAVKKVSHESRQGMKQFVAEIVSIGRMSHRNLVPLLGYCRRKGELLLVYDFMPNGSLDRYLYNKPEVTLNWKQRINVILGVASGLFYLHEERPHSFHKPRILSPFSPPSSAAMESSKNSLIPSFLYSSSSSPRSVLLDQVINSNSNAAFQSPNLEKNSPSPSPKTMASRKNFLIASPTEPGKGIEMYSRDFYAACTVGGILSCGLTHMAVTPLDLVKCNMQIDPAKYKSISSGFGILLKEQGVRGFFRGWVPTLLGYSAQGACKFGFYEFFKKYYSDLAGPEFAAKYKTLIYLAGSASAEVIADVALCPFEAVKVRVQTQPGFARGMSDGFPKFVKSEGYGGLYKGLAPLWGRQIPYTMMKFASFETIVEMIYKYAIPNPKHECSKGLQLGVSFAGGYVAGVFCAIVSHPADNLVSFLNNAKGATVGDAVKKIGMVGLFTRGLPLRIVMIGTLTGAQWGLYDAFKVFVGLPTTGGVTPAPAAKA